MLSLLLVIGEIWLTLGNLTNGIVIQGKSNGRMIYLVVKPKKLITYCLFASSSDIFPDIFNSSRWVSTEVSEVICFLHVGFRQDFPARVTSAFFTSDVVRSSSFSSGCLWHPLFDNGEVVCFRYFLFGATPSL